MTALTARNVALTDQILAALTDEGGLPISTMGLLEKLNAAYPEPTLRDLLGAASSGQLSGEGERPLRVYHGDLLRMLNRLAKRGEVEKIEVPDMRCRYWRRWVQERPS
jgi:hypothetical protein